MHNENSFDFKDFKIWHVLKLTSFDFKDVKILHVQMRNLWILWILKIWHLQKLKLFDFKDS